MLLLWQEKGLLCLSKGSELNRRGKWEENVTLVFIWSIVICSLSNGNSRAHVNYNLRRRV